MSLTAAQLQAAGDEAVAHLCDMVRFDTTNPPGNELALVRYLADLLSAEGVEARVLESAPDRANLVARLPATRRRERAVPARPLLMLSHLDVVPAEADEWTHPPFAGLRADGMVWGPATYSLTRNCSPLATPLALKTRANTP